jgi:Fe-S cluster assembly iron-binding protein IscA
MLTITPTAAEVIKDLMVASPDAVGIRLAAKTGHSPNGSQPSALIQIELAPEVGETEEVIEEQGAQVFVEPGLAAYLADKVLDVELDGEQAAFIVTEQEEI